MTTPSIYRAAVYSSLAIALAAVIICGAGCTTALPPIADEKRTGAENEWVNTLKAWYPDWRPPDTAVTVRSPRRAEAAPANSGSGVETLPDALEETGTTTRVIPANTVRMVIVSEDDIPPPRPSPPGAVPSVRKYTIQKGDTLRKIARLLYSDASAWKKIFAANRDQISDPDRIKPGVRLVIP